MSDKSEATTVTDPTLTNTDDVAIPSVKAVEKEIEAALSPDRDYVELPDNLAEHYDVAEAFCKAAHQKYLLYIGSPERKKLDERIQDADAKFRMAVPKTQRFRSTSNQKNDNMSNVASSQFYKSITLLTSAINSVLFGTEGEPPVDYLPDENAQDYTTEEGKRIADSRTNCFARWYNIIEDDGMTVEQKLKDMVLFAEKNSIEIYTIQWEYQTQTKPERVPGYYDADGNPTEHKPGEPLPQDPVTGEVLAFDRKGLPLEYVYDEETGRPLSYVFVEKTRTIKEQPVCERVDVNNIQWDLTLPMCMQECVIVRSQKSFDYLIAKQKAGEYVNVELVGKAHLFSDHSNDGQVTEQNKQDNADEDSSLNGNPNGKVDLYHVWQNCTIDEDGDTPKWGGDAIPRVYEAVYAGFGGYMNKQVAQAKKEKAKGAVCLQLRRNPYHHGRIPYYEMYSLPDDKTGPKMGYIDLLTCNVEEQDTTANDHFDNNRLRMYRPFLAEKGNVLARSLKFRKANHVIWCQNLSRTPLTQLQVEDITSTTIATQESLKKDAEEITRTSAVIQGEYAGARATGTEVLEVKSQAMKPVIEMAKRTGTFLYVIGRDVAELYEQFADPDNPLNYQGSAYNPAEHYGPSIVRIKSIPNFEADLAAKQTLMSFIQAGGYEQSKHLMGGVQGETEFWRTYGKINKFPNYEKIWPGIAMTKEAENQALADWNAIVADPAAAMQNIEIQPKRGEMHEVHIRVLNRQKAVFVPYSLTFEPEDQPHARLIIAATDMWIELHRQLMEDEGQAAAGGQPGSQPTQLQGQALTAPGMSGEAAGDSLAGAAVQA